MIVFARLASDNSYVANSGTSVMAMSPGQVSYNLGMNLAYSTNYIFVTCIGTALAGQASTCSGPEYTVAYTTPTLATPTVSVSGTGSSATVNITSADANPMGGWVFYNASDLNTPLLTVQTAFNNTYTFGNLSPLATGVSYVTKFCTSITAPMPTRTCSVSASLSAASAQFSVAATGGGSGGGNPPSRALHTSSKATFKICGQEAISGQTIEVVGLIAKVPVEVALEDGFARAYVTVPATPALGNNNVTVFVQAENGTMTEYSFNIHITAAPVAPPVVTPPVVTPPVVAPPLVAPPEKSKDATAVITVAGIAVTDGDHVNLPFGTSTVSVLVTPTESHATYTVTGNTGLQPGTSNLTVTVTAEDGTIKAYSYQLVVAADKSPVNLGVSGASTLQQVQAALDAGRVANFTVTAKGVSAASKVLAQIRAFKTALRASGSRARVASTLTERRDSAMGLVRIWN